MLSTITQCRSNMVRLWILIEKITIINCFKSILLAHYIYIGSYLVQIVEKETSLEQYALLLLNGTHRFHKTALRSRTPEINVIGTN